MLSSVSFIQNLGTAAQYNVNNANSLDLIIGDVDGSGAIDPGETASVAAGHSIVLQFSMKPSDKHTPPTPTAFIHAPGSSTHLVDFHLDAQAQNDAPGGGPGGAVRLALFSAHGVAAIPTGKRDHD